MVLRSLTEINAFGVVRTSLAKCDARRQISSMKVQRNYGPIRPLRLRDFQLRAEARDSTFFILGSGASVENLTDANFAEIAGGFSIGINAWVLHDFVPDAYAYEPVENVHTDHFYTLSFLNRPNVLEAKPLVLVLRPRNEFEFSQLAQIPEPLRARTRIYGRVSPYTRRESNLESDLKSMTSLLSKSYFESVVVDSGASIVRMAHLGLKLGYKRIVFVGVDLNNVEYFWERNPSYLANRGIESFKSGQTGETHETLRGLSRPFPVDVMIAQLASVAKAKFSCEFAVASPNSALAGMVPAHEWAN